MSEKPLISVVIPTYNHAHFLKESLGSVVAQTFANWEALVIDNSSTDKTREVVEGFSDPRIRFYQIQNQGVIAKSRNFGIQKAQGEYIAFLDSDDFWFPSKVEKCLKRLQEGSNLVCHSELWFGEAWGKVVHYGPAAAATFEHLLYSGNCISTSAVVLRKELLDKWGGFSEDRQFVTAEDYDLWLRFAQAGECAVFINEILGTYRIHTGGASSSVEKNARAIIAVSEKYFSIASSRTQNRGILERQCRANIFYAAARGFHRVGDRKSERKYFLRAIGKYPLHFKSWLFLVAGLFR